MEKVDYIIKADYVLPMEEDMRVIKDGAVAVKDKDIVKVGTFVEVSKEYTPERIMGGQGRAIFPGLVNTHTHAPMVYFRGLADDLPLKEWLEGHIWPAEAKWMDYDFVYDATQLACLEMLKAGVTTYSDMYFYEDASGKVIEKIGMRAVLGVGILDFPTKFAQCTEEYLTNAENFVRGWRGNEVVTPCVAPHATYTCGPETFKKAQDLAEKYDVPLHIHLSETKWEFSEIQRRYGKTPVEHLDSIGFLSKQVHAAHCVWLTDKDIEILAKRQVGVSHCVESNLKLASGIAPVPKMLKAGVKVTFGTDGAASNNDLNILSEMSTSAKLYKAHSEDPTVLDSRTVLLMATRWGAEVLCLGDTTGSITPGKRADLVMVNLEKPHLTPIYDIYSHVVYSLRPSDVETVVVNGRIVVNGGRLVTADEAEIMDRAKMWQKRIKSE